ncbi:MAG: NADH-quinone oxidoreductase subunit A [Planctomycetota bacterium]|jgi:NADH-quinone oxidoreductase subunit A
MLAAASTFFEGFGNVLVFCVFGAIFVWLNLFVLSTLVLKRPSRPEFGSKNETFECGEPTIGTAWIRFDIRFYTLSLIFLIFDIEVALLFPWAAVYDEFIAAGLGFAAFVEVLVFLVVLGVGLAYVWVKRDLEWTSTKPGRAVSEEALIGAVDDVPAAPATMEESVV